MRKKWRWFTIMIIPHDEESAFCVRLPLVVFQAAVSLVIIATIVMLNFAGIYRQRLSEAQEARVLRETNRVQKEEIDRFESQTLVLKEKVDEIEQVAEVLLDRLGIPLDEDDESARE